MDHVGDDSFAEAAFFVLAHAAVQPKQRDSATSSARSSLILDRTLSLYTITRIRDRTDVDDRGLNSEFLYSRIYQRWRSVHAATRHLP